MRGIRKSGFACCGDLTASVIAALRADAVRATLCAALRACLDHNRRRLLVRVAGALLTLRCPSFRYGHGFSLVGLPGAHVRTLVQIGAAIRAEPPAIRGTLHERGNVQQPLLSHSRPEIHFRAAPTLTKRKYIGVLFVDVECVGVQHMHFRRLGSHDFRKAPTAFAGHVTSQRTAEIVPAVACN